MANVLQLSGAPQSNTFPDVSITTSDYVAGANSSLLVENISGFVSVIWPPSPNVASYRGSANMISVQTGSYDAAVISRFPGPNRMFVTFCQPINSWYHLTQYKSDMPLHDIATGPVVAMMAGQPGDRNGSVLTGKIVQMRPDANTTFFVVPFPAEGSA